MAGQVARIRWGGVPHALEPVHIMLVTYTIVFSKISRLPLSCRQRLPCVSVLQACCQQVCKEFSSLSAMVGLQCCGAEPINYFNKICCQGRTSARREGNKYRDRCCGTVPYGFDQTCCQNKVSTWKLRTHTVCPWTWSHPQTCGTDPVGDSMGRLWVTVKAIFGYSQTSLTGTLWDQGNLSILTRDPYY